MSERLKDFWTFEKSRAALEKYVGNVDNISKVEKVLEIIGSEEKLNECLNAVWAVECAGIENYAQQIQQFVNGFRGCEAPYIFAGLNAFLEAALSAPPFNDPEIKKKYDYCRENLKESALAVMFANVPKKKPEGDE